MLVTTTNDTGRESFPAIEDSETELCSTLWICVALQAVVDARNKSKKGKYEQYKRQAINWLRAPEGENSEFAMVCQLAGLNFEKTRTRLLRIASNKNETADFRCIKKALLGNRGMELRSNYLKRMRRQEKMREYNRSKREAARKALESTPPAPPLARCA